MVQTVMGKIGSLARRLTELLRESAGSGMVVKLSSGFCSVYPSKGAGRLGWFNSLLGGRRRMPSERTAVQKFRMGHFHTVLYGPRTF